jgi:type II secretory ATPase GspE/PulE/Tfp pilus assembly ATPase PilB-like protein
MGNMVVNEHVMADPIERLVRLAYASGATDVHIEPGEGGGYQVRVRVNGVLQRWEVTEGTLEQTVSRVKLMARMDIAERRLPQDGSFRVAVGEQESVDVRVSSLPTVNGEKIAMRLLQSRTRHSLDDLGLDKQQRRMLLSWIEARHGLVLVTGPTGSGKTTTLYAALMHRRDAGVNLSTLENPVEVKLPGINQVEIQPRTGLTFATGLRSILRQDPDVLMIGEIRDQETAEATARAAMTGHLVLSSLHSDSAVGALLRLVDLGVPPQVVAASLRGVVGQRLVETHEGRRAVFEMLPMTESIRQGLYQRADVRELTLRARREGVRLMADVLNDWLDHGLIEEGTYDRLIGERVML